MGSIMGLFEIISQLLTPLCNYSHQSRAFESQVSLLNFLLFEVLCVRRYFSANFPCCILFHFFYILFFTNPIINLFVFQFHLLFRLDWNEKFFKEVMKVLIKFSLILFFFLLTIFYILLISFFLFRFFLLLFLLIIFLNLLHPPFGIWNIYDII